MSYLKREIRLRMKQTGEKYTQARRAVMAAREQAERDGRLKEHEREMIEKMKAEEEKA